jgi:hypothetical protein
MKFEFAVKAFDSEDLASGHKRSKKGDIIAYKPYPHTWGSCEQNDYIHIVVDGLTEEETQQMCLPYYEGGVETFDIEKQPKVLGKRKYAFDFDKLKAGWKPDLDMAKIEDSNVKYQPFKDENIVIDMTEKVAIVKDKHKGGFKYKTEK